MLREALPELRRLIELHPDVPTYASALADVEGAIDGLEPTATRPWTPMGRREGILESPFTRVWHATESVRMRAYSSDEQARSTPQYVYETEDGRAHARLATFGSTEPTETTHHESLDALLRFYSMTADDLVELRAAG